jgi:hypothetical protein
LNFWSTAVISAWKEMATTSKNRLHVCLCNQRVLPITFYITNKKN